MENLDLPSIDGNQVLAGKGGKGADGITGGHVREVRQVLTTQGNIQRTMVICQSIMVFQDHQSLCQTPADMFLRKVDGAVVRIS